MPPATSDDQLAAASLHYHAGRYEQAAAAFRAIADDAPTDDPPPPPSACSRKRKIDQCLDGDIGDGNAGIIFAALPSLSVEADAALSAARSALATRARGGSIAAADSSENNATAVIRAALDANATYRSALLSASMALRRLTIGKEDCSSSPSQVAISFLMAGTAASWLHMAVGDGPSAQHVLVDALRGAASCFFADEGAGSSDVLPPAMLPMTNEEAWHLIRSGLLLGADNNEHTTNEEERCQIAFRTFCNAIRVANLGGARINIPTPPNVSETDDNDENETLVGGVGLKRQELLVHAITLHGSLNGQTDEKVRIDKTKERDSLLKDAASLEAHLGQARRLQILLNGLKLLSSPTTNKSGDSNAPAGSDTIAGLKTLASSSRTARAMLGCIYASKGQHALALDAWQRAIELGDNDVGSREYRATILGISNSFVMLGDATPAEELLLHLNAKPATSSSGSGQNGTALKIALGDNDNNTSTKDVDLLWRIFFVSTLAEDWATCLAVAENLVDSIGSDNPHLDDVPCARAACIFALLQCHRYPDALSKYVEWCDHRDVGGSLGALFALYEADGLISTEGGSVETPKTKSVYKGISNVSEKCQLAIEKQIESEEVTDKVVNDDGSCDDDPSLDVATDNNQGISFILEGNTKEALLAFEDASKSRSDSDWLLLRPRFNLSLLLWREGNRTEAANVWMGTRNLGDSGNDSYQGKDLRAKMDEAISRHGLYCAKKRSKSDEISREAADGAKVLPWRSGNGQNAGDGENISHLSGMDLEQILAFDVAVLQHAVAERSRKKSSRNSFGGS